MALQVDSHATTPIAAIHTAPSPLQTTAATTVKVKAVTPSEPVAKTPVKVAAPADTVKLSLSAQIHQLKSQGQDAGQIATSLGIDTKTVDSFLNTAANEPPVPAPLPGASSATGSVTTPVASAPTTAAPAASPAVAPKTTIAQTALDVSQVGAAAA